mgnify:CR=1 FL=1
MKIAISAESAIDMPKELLEKYDIHVVPFTIILGEEQRLDGDIKPAEIFEFVEKTKQLPKTSAVNEEQFLEHFGSLLKDYDAVIHLSMSSELSSACSNAKKAAAKLGNVRVIDTRSLSTGIAVISIYAQKLVGMGLSLDEVVKKVEEKVPHIQISFVLKKLNYLYKGGRCSSLMYFGANLLGIKPQIIAKDGKLISHHKYRGTMEKVVADYCRDTLKEFNTPDKEVAFVTYTVASDEMVQNAVDALKNAGFKNIYLTHAGGTVSSHCGENTLGIIYLNSND